MKEITKHLRQFLIQRMVEAGDQSPQIDYWPYYPWKAARTKQQASTTRKQEKGER